MHNLIDMLTLLHGDDIVSSRNYYLLEKQKVQEKKIVDGTTISITDLMQIFSGNGLFGDQEVIFIEDLVSKRKSSKDIEQFIDFLNKQQDAQIVVWESKTLTPKQLTLFKKATIKAFPIPPVVFAFLDSLAPGNTIQMIKLYHEVLEHEDAGYVLIMLIRHIRILLALKEQNAEETISELSRMAPWQQTKLQKQSNQFDKTQLLILHSQLFDLEYDQKTGNLTTSLTDAIDFFLASL